jgi:hypothetical protein
MHDRDWIAIASTAWIIGLAALLCDHFQPYRPLIVALHALFAVASCGAICLIVIPRARALAGSSQTELYLFTRLVSRWVYISMYILAIVWVGLSLHDAGRYCAACTTPAPPADFQFYVASCVAPWWLVRAIVLAVPFKTCNGERALL